MSENREYKSDTFSMLMEEPKYALAVYNALNGTSYADESELERKQLENGIALSMRNDASFVIAAEINIYEHQSTYNPNMPLRSVLYYDDIIRPFVKNRDLYGRKKILIPVPRFVVFYNGVEDRPAIEIQKLSDLYEKEVDYPELEAIVTVYNINPGKNDGLLENCEPLRGYTYLVETVRRLLAEGVEKEDAVPMAIDDCIENHILEDFFRERRDEVERNMTIDMTWEAREKIIRRDEREEGRIETLQWIEESMRKNGISEKQIQSIIEDARNQ